MPAVTKRSTKSTDNASWPGGRRSRAQRRWTIQTSLPKNRLHLRSFTVQEEISRPFQIEAELLASDHTLDVDRMIGESALITVDLGQGKRRHFHGRVASVEQEDAEGGQDRYRATLVPWLWLLTRTADCRIFQDQTVPEILKAVFREYGFSDVQDCLKREYAPWSYCVQYRESDFNFVSRLMEHEGIYYYWRHTAKKHEMVLVDDVSSHVACPGFEKLPYRGVSAGYSGVGQVQSWRVRQVLQPGIYALSDYNFQKPRASLLAKSASNRQQPGERWEVFDYPGEYEEHREGESYARLRVEELQARTEIVSATTDAEGLWAGGQFSLQRHPRRDQNRLYLITSCHYSFGDNHHRAEVEGQDTPVHCEFTAMDSRQQYRPVRMTPKPMIQGPQTAIVVGAKGDEIYVDDYGRVKVQFHWDRYGRRDQNSSCWIRVSQPWAGKGYGAMNIPRVGCEVIVEFLEGDPDQPIINGRIYNADTMPHASNAGRDGKKDNSPPSGIAAAAMMTSFKSNSLGGSGGSNEITMNDTGGAEGLFFKAQKDETHVVGNDREDSVGNNETRNVGVNRTETIGNNASETVMAAKVVDVGTTLLIKAGTSITLQCGASTIHMNQAGFITISGTVISTAATVNASVVAPLTEIVGAAMLAEAGGLIKIFGGATHVGAAGMTKISGNTVFSEAKTSNVTSGVTVASVASAENIVQGAVVKLN